MPLPDSAQKVVHVTLSGTMLGGGEEWQTGFYMGSATADAPTPTQAFVDLVRDQWATYFAASGNFISYAYAFTAVKAVLLEKNGSYGSNEPVESFPASSVAGGYVGAPLPPQIALVATLIAGSGKGLAGKGRMYLPGVSAPIDTTGHLLNTTCQGIATNLAAFFDALDASVDAPGHVINVSRGHKLLGEPTPIYTNARNVPVNGVRVGNVYDTQRRRRNALAETYYPHVVAD